MQTGFDGENLQAAKEKLEKLARNPAKFKLIVLGLIMGVGVFGLCRPQAQRIVAARDKLKRVEKQAKTAEDAAYLIGQGAIYEDRVCPENTIGNWQDYVMQQLQKTGVKLRSLNPRRETTKGRFKLIELNMILQGDPAELLEVIDLLERGERLVRLTNLIFEKAKDYDVLMTCVVMGLAQSRPKKAPKSYKKAKA